jgi:hypothetical protein
VSRPALRPTQPPVQWVQGALSLEVKGPGREADHSPPSSAEVKECVELYLQYPNAPSWRVPWPIGCKSFAPQPCLQKFKYTKTVSHRIYKTFLIHLWKTFPVFRSNDSLTFNATNTKLNIGITRLPCCFTFDTEEASTKAACLSKIHCHTETDSHTTALATSLLSSPPKQRGSQVGITDGIM